MIGQKLPKSYAQRASEKNHSYVNTYKVSTELFRNAHLVSAHANKSTNEIYPF